VSGEEAFAHIFYDVEIFAGPLHLDMVYAIIAFFFRNDGAACARVRYDGLSGNQVLLLQALDTFLGIEQYLSQKD
jgi:hypothetical protein